MKRCETCGAEMPGAHFNRKFCSGRCRKAQYGDPCVDCGARTRFGAEMARVAEPRCPTCAMARRRVWTRELIIEALHTWVSRHGEPPALADWRPYTARHEYGDEERARRGEAGIRSHEHPSSQRVIDEFGSWNAAMVAAGLAPRAGHGGAGNQLRRRAVAA